MNRRNFLLGSAAAATAVAVAPLVPLLPEVEPIFEGYVGTYEGIRICEGGGYLYSDELSDELRKRLMPLMMFRVETSTGSIAIVTGGADFGRS